MDGELSITRT